VAWLFRPLQLKRPADGSAEDEQQAKRAKPDTADGTDASALEASPGGSGARARVRQTEGTGLVDLNNLLKALLDEVQLEKDFWPFFSPVPTTGKLGIVDYPQCVPAPTWRAVNADACSSGSPQIPVSCFSSRELNVGLETWLSRGVHNADLC
jgi:hypothetical protein